MSSHDDLIAQYSGITGESTAKSRQYLEAFEWNLEVAVEDHYSRQQDSDNDQDYEDEDVTEAPQDTTRGGRRLGDDSATGSSAPRAPPTSAQIKKTPTPAPTKKIATLGDFGSSGVQDESEDEDHQDMFAGGEKSGLAVQNPDDLKKKIIEKAARGGPRPSDEPTKKSHFTGAARTLGGDDAPSREIPAAPQARTAERVNRTLHFWRDGFSIDDGNLYRFDDPRNSEVLQLIRSGRAPPHIMNVQPGQEVDVEIKPHEEDFVPPKRTYKPFEGRGNRLGSPTPGVPSTISMPGAFTADTPAESSSSSAATPASQVDESRPVVTIRISLGSGTRLTSRFNTDQTVGDVYDFVAHADAVRRDFVLQTTFPTIELKDKSKALGDLSEFKRGGAIIQRYL